MDFCGGGGDGYDAARFPHSSGTSGHVAGCVGIPVPHVCSANWLREDLAGIVSNPHPGLYVTFALGERKWVDNVV